MVVGTGVSLRDFLDKKKPVDHKKKVSQRSPAAARPQPATPAAAPQQGAARRIPIVYRSKRGIFVEGEKLPAIQGRGGGNRRTRGVVYVKGEKQPFSVQAFAKHAGQRASYPYRAMKVVGSGGQSLEAFLDEGEAAEQQQQPPSSSEEDESELSASAGAGDGDGEEDNPTPQHAQYGASDEDDEEVKIRELVREGTPLPASPPPRFDDGPGQASRPKRSLTPQEEENAPAPKRQKPAVAPAPAAAEAAVIQELRRELRVAEMNNKVLVAESAALKKVNAQLEQFNAHLLANNAQKDVLMAKLLADTARR